MTHWLTRACSRPGWVHAWLLSRSVSFLSPAQCFGSNQRSFALQVARLRPAQGFRNGQTKTGTQIDQAASRAMLLQRANKG